MNRELDWIEVTVAQIAATTPQAISIGPFGSRMKADRYVPCGEGAVPVVRGTNISDTKELTGEFVFVNPETASELKSAIVFPGDLIFPHRGLIGQVGLVPEGKWKRYMLSTSLMKLTCNPVVADPQFVFYFFRSPIGKHELLKHASQVGTPGIATPLRSLRSIPLAIPSLAEQRAIAHILGTLDDKIELNHRTNHTLEAIARALFTSWFVAFDPVRAKVDGRQPAGMDAATAALFPSAFETTQDGVIPKGWDAAVFGALAVNHRRTVDPRTVNPATPYIGLEHMPRRRIALDSWGTAEGVESGKTRFDQGDVLFGKLRPYFHKVGIAPLDGICSTDILVFKPKRPEMCALVLLHSSSNAFVAYADGGSHGTRMPRASWDRLEKYPVSIPPAPLLQTFDRIVQPLLAQMRLNIFQSRSLAELRDTLLPRLLAGDLRVPEAERLLAQEPV